MLYVDKIEVATNYRVNLSYSQYDSSNIPSPHRGSYNDHIRFFNSYVCCAVYNTISIYILHAVVSSWCERETNKNIFVSSVHAARSVHESDITAFHLLNASSSQYMYLHFNPFSHTTPG